MNMARVWPIVVEFGVGAFLCGIGIWCGIRSGFLDLRVPEGKRMLMVLAGGFLALLALVCAFTFWLPFAGQVGAAP